jgi:hypothetical protein
MCVCVCVCVYVYIYRCVCVCVYVYIYIYIYRWCTNSGRQVAVANKFCMVAPNICGSSGWNLLHVTQVASKILRWLVGFWRICAPLCIHVCVDTQLIRKAQTHAKSQIRPVRIFKQYIKFIREQVMVAQRGSRVIVLLFL